jgi:membrane fusion protein, multidrug efflux system
MRRLSQPGTMRKRLWVVVVVIVLAVVIGATLFRRARVEAAQSKKGDAAAMQRPIPVLGAPVVVRDMPVYLRGLGTVAAYNTVAVKSRVDGQLVNVNFQEGQEVRAGDLLAQIDPRPFEVQLHQAEANLAKDQAQVTDAKVNLERFTALYKEGVIAKQQLDAQSALVGQLEGAIGADKAQVENAKLQLVYSRITAPISGRVGLRIVDPGNIVHASDTNPMLVITQLQPITVIFTLPEDYIPVILKHMRQGDLQVEAYSRDDKTKIGTGRLLTINNEIDPSTGTNRLKAVFDNSERLLWPNQFVNMRLLLDVKKNATTVPVAALQNGNQGTLVFVVKPDKSVEVRAVKVGFTEANTASIDQGLTPGEVVVTEGQDKLQPNSRVEVQQQGSAPSRQASGPVRQSSDSIRQESGDRETGSSDHLRSDHPMSRSNP